MCICVHTCVEARHHSQVCFSITLLFFEVGSFADHGMEFCDKRALGLSLSLFSRIGLQTYVTNPDFTQARDPDSGLHVCVTSILMTEPFPDP